MMTFAFPEKDADSIDEEYEMEKKQKKKGKKGKVRFKIWKRKKNFFVV